MTSMSRYCHLFLGVRPRKFSASVMPQSYPDGHHDCMWRYHLPTLWSWAVPVGKKLWEWGGFFCCLLRLPSPPALDLQDLVSEALVSLPLLSSGPNVQSKKRIWEGINSWSSHHSVFKQMLFPRLISELQTQKPKWRHISSALGCLQTLRLPGL